MRIPIRQSTEADIEYIAANMRKEDVEEVAASDGGTPEAALRLGYEVCNPCWTALVDDKPAAMFGIGTFAGEGIFNSEMVGIIWLLGTPAITKYGQAFAKHSKLWLDAAMEHYDVLYAMMDCRQEVHARWLRWCGFHIDHIIDRYGIHQLPFALWKRRAARPSNLIQEFEQCVTPQA